MRVCCNDCGTNAEFTLESWRCECGGAWEPVFPSGFDPDRINEADYSIWRYGDLMPLDVHQAFAGNGRWLDAAGTGKPCRTRSPS